MRFQNSAARTSISAIKAPAQLVPVCERVLKLSAPPDDLTVSQWADKYRILSPEGSASPGRWNTADAEYQRAVMDAFTDPHVHTIVMLWASQLGKSEILMNMMARSIHLDPGPMMFVFPDKENAREFIKDRLTTMIRDTPVLRERVLPDRGNRGNSNSDLFVKRFKGGYLAVASANVPASLASKPIRDLYCDEVDRYNSSAGREGDPVELAAKRQTTFWNAKKVLTSTPGNDIESRIVPAYAQTDQREYYVPCPHCGEYQTLEWANVQWDKRIVDGRREHLPETARMVCSHCGVLLYEADKFAMIPFGKWIANAPNNGSVGFRLNTLYSPWFTWAKLVQEWLHAQGKPDEIKVFVNTRLGEAYAESGDTIKETDLYYRREKYTAPIPMGAFVLTAGVDVQNDRIEALVHGWGRGEETWVIDHAVLWGDPKESRVWQELEQYLDRDWLHESGVKLRLSATCVDSGFLTQIVYDFCRGKTGRRIFATKGMDGEGRPVLTSPAAKRTGTNERPVELFTVGTDTTKELVYLRLNRSEPGPGYFHFPDRLTEEYFRQLAAEKMIRKYERGYPKKVWVKTRPRNEILDMTVLAYAALKQLAPNWEDWRARILPTAPEEILPPISAPSASGDAAPAGLGKVSGSRHRRVIGKMF